MTPTELRALADALEPLASLGRSGSQGALALESTIAYLRAQADAQPVAWIAHNLTTGHVKWTTDRCRAHGWIQGGNLRVKSLYAHPAPQSPSDASHIYRPTSDAAQPQTEPSEFKFQPRAGALARSWDRADALAEPKEENNVWKQIIPDDAPQAEPKREPLSDERIAEIQRAAYERAAQECIETAAELRRCADGCTDGRYDWKADGAADCADAISALGRQQ